MKIEIKDFNLFTIANSGQCFRLNQINDNLYSLVYKNNVLFVKQLDKNMFDFSCSVDKFNKIYFEYFDLGTNYNKYKKVVDSNDLFLKNCIKYSSGLRILRQEPFETLISFIISQRKSIPAIKTSIERLSKVCGNMIKTKYGDFYSFPTAKSIYENRNKIDNCGLGYRKDYIIDTSYRILSNDIDLYKLYDLDNVDLKNCLLSLKGVGEKVASCIMLFAYSRYDICPVDVWIDRVLKLKYKNQLPKKYEKYAGIIQQYWFYYAKDHKIF